MLKVNQLNAGYGKFQILYDISLKAERDAVTVIVGPNGSGKTTLLKSVAGLATVYSGEILLEDNCIRGHKPYEIASMGVAYLPQVGNVFQNLTVEENLRMAGYLLSDGEYKEGLSEAFRVFPQVKDWLHKPVWWLSGGERQVLAISMAIVRNTKLMLMDEPTAALAPKLAAQILDKIKQAGRELGITVLLVEQNALRALEISDYAYLLVAGRVAYNGDSRDMLNNPKLASMYLGVKYKATAE